MRKTICILIASMLILGVASGCGNSTSTASNANSAGNTASTTPAKAGDAYPSRPIELIVPFSAGGTTDIAARVLSKTASKYLPTSQTIVVINKPGVSGTMGISDLLKADPDGYTLMLGASTGFSQSPYIVPNIKFDYTDVSYLMKTANLPVFLQVRNDSKFKTLSDMITYMKDTNNVPVTIGTIGVGTAGHLAMEKIRKDFGISNYTNIPFKSTADAWNGLTQGGVDAILCATDIDVDFLRLATASSKRSTLYPDVPTFTEMGYPMNIGTTNVLVTDKDVPQEIQDVLIDAFTKAMNDPETIATFKKVGIDLDFQNAADTKKMVEEELSWGPDMLKDLGLYVNDPHQK